VLDGGTTCAAQPYFVMDLVKGVPMTRYCNEHQLTPRQRLELFLPVCEAVQHAHRKGVLHRDLKPSNVLVAVHSAPGGRRHLHYRRLIAKPPAVSWSDAQGGYPLELAAIQRRVNDPRAVSLNPLVVAGPAGRRKDLAGASAT
jgi:hypothetical protein